MELLELTLSPMNERRFLTNSTRVPDGDGIGDASAECDLPFWAGEQDWRRTIIKILESSQGFRSENFPEVGEQDWLEQEKLLLRDRQHFNPDYLRQIGEALYQSLFPPDSGIKWVLQHSLRLAEKRNTNLHLRLKFAAASVQRSRLADYPWELLHDGQRFLLHHRVRLSRYIAYESSPPQLPAQEQVRVLLISARPQGLAQLTQEEQQVIQAGLERAQDARLVQLQILPSPTRKNLNLYLTNCSSQEMPQVLHFDGHGVFGKRCTNPECLKMHPGIRTESCSACRQPLPEPQGYLAFETEQGTPDWQSAKQVAAILQPHSNSIALVVLSACQSGMAVAGDSVFNGMAQNLIDQRIPAVVAMQYSVRADAARVFAEQFYRELGKKKTLLTALNRGIGEMNVEGNQWYRPVLYLRWHDNEGGQLFAAQPQPVHPEQEESDRIIKDRFQVGDKDVDGPKLVRIPAGRYSISSEEDETVINEFAIGQFPVTFCEYDLFCEASGYEKPNDMGWGRKNRPVINVSFFDAINYIKWLCQRTGKEYRLPTAVEWEYAARAKTDSAYWWGNEIKRDDKFMANCNGYEDSQDKKRKTSRVGYFPPNDWNLYDTAGNVWEWTRTRDDGIEAEVLSDESSQVIIKGGSWYDKPDRLHWSIRQPFWPDDKSDSIGFRVSRSLSSLG